MKVCDFDGCKHIQDLEREARALDNNIAQLKAENEAMGKVLAALRACIKQQQEPRKEDGT